jgi:hypothetical protein
MFCELLCDTANVVTKNLMSCVYVCKRPIVGLSPTLRWALQERFPVSSKRSEKAVGSGAYVRHELSGGVSVRMNDFLRSKRGKEQLETMKEISTQSDLTLGKSARRDK